MDITYYTKLRETFPELSFAILQAYTTLKDLPRSTPYTTTQSFYDEREINKEYVFNQYEDFIIIEKNQDKFVDVYCYDKFIFYLIDPTPFRDYTSVVNYVKSLSCFSSNLHYLGDVYESKIDKYSQNNECNFLRDVCSWKIKDFVLTPLGNNRFIREEKGLYYLETRISANEYISLARSEIVKSILLGLEEETFKTELSKRLIDYILTLHSKLDLTKFDDILFEKLSKYGKGYPRIYVELMKILNNPLPFKRVTNEMIKDAIITYGDYHKEKLVIKMI